MTDSIGRFRSGIYAHLYAQVVTIVTQLASLPIFLSAWTIEEYGTWLILTAIPTYLAMADFGICTSAGNQMTMLMAQRKNTEYDTVFRGMVFLVTALCLLLLIISMSFWIIFGNSFEHAKTIVTLIVVSILVLFSGIFDAVYRSRGDYPLVTVLLTTTRVVEWLISVLLVLMDLGLIGAALGLLVGRLACTAIIGYVSARKYVYLDWRFWRTDISNTKTILKSGIGFLAFPLGTLLSVQGIILVIGWLFGPIITATFSSLRTLTRFLTQISILSGKSLSPEVSILIGKGRIDEALKITAEIKKKVSILMFACGILLLVFGENIVKIWGGGKIQFDYFLFCILIISAILSGYWQIISTIFTASNRHAKIAVAFLAISFTSVIMCIILSKILGPNGMAIGIFLGESAMVFYVSRLLKHLFLRRDI